MANESWTFKEQDIDLVNNFNYFGCVLNYTGSCLLHNKFIVGKGIKASNALMVTIRKYNMKVNMLCQLFHSFVGATLNYGCEIIGFSKSKQIERVHLKILKQILHVKQSTSSMGIYGEIGRYQLYIARYYRIIRYWCKVIATDNVIINRLYQTMLSECIKGCNNWAKNVKNILDTSGLSYAWENQSINISIGAAYLRKNVR